mgnify:CR=1 FL=1
MICTIDPNLTTRLRFTLPRDLNALEHERFGAVSATHRRPGQQCARHRLGLYLNKYANDFDSFGEAGARSLSLVLRGTGPKKTGLGLGPGVACG